MLNLSAYLPKLGSQAENFSPIIVMPNREVRLGCLFLAEIRQAKMVSFVGESIEVIGDRQS